MIGQSWYLQRLFQSYLSEYRADRFSKSSLAANALLSTTTWVPNSFPCKTRAYSRTCLLSPLISKTLQRSLLAPMESLDSILCGCFLRARSVGRRCGPLGENVTPCAKLASKLIFGYSTSRRPPPKEMMNLLTEDQRSRVEHVACDFLSKPEEIVKQLKDKNVTADYVFFCT